MYAIGNPYKIVSTSNCYVIDCPLDSYSSICATDEQIVNVCKVRGGVGTDLSNLRPVGTPTNNAAKSSSGVVSFMRRYSNSIREVGQQNRRGAGMLTIDIQHPESENFIKAKADLTEITGANTSIKLYDRFMKAAIQKSNFVLQWPVDSDTPSVTKEINAEDLWNTVVTQAHATAEPGILFWDTIIKGGLSDCYEHLGYKTVSTNPCSELGLDEGSACRLLAINLFSFVDNPFTDKAEFNFDKFSEVVKKAQRIMDDIVDLETERIEKIILKTINGPEDFNVKSRMVAFWTKVLNKCRDARRTGTGITALGDMFAALGLKYGSADSIHFADRLFMLFKHSAIESSVDMAKELGPFKGFSAAAERHCKFNTKLKNENRKLYNKMMKYGRRNIGLLTIAPTGSVSILTQTTSGIEPLYEVSCIRRRKLTDSDDKVKPDFIDKTGDKWKNYEVYHPKVKDWMEVTGETDISKSPWHGSTAYAIDWIKRVVLQAKINEHIDHNISSTINLPNDASVDTVKAIYEKAWALGCKGITVYRDGCRDGVLIKNTPKSKIPKTDAIKRPKNLPCDVYHIKVKNEHYFVLVGILDGEPFEVFAGKNNCINRAVKKGVISKKKRGYYTAEFDDGSDLDNITDYLSDEQEAITRLVSTSLRHGASMHFIVHQLEKVKGDLFTFSRSLARAIKKYIPDGTKVSGESCPRCINHGMTDTVIRQDGCKMCTQCGWTECQ
jgi:ribonucleoside-diphosphate reductase alpha chain